MGVLYYIKGDPQLATPREFDAALFWKLAQSKQGELFLSQGKEKVVYDATKGIADLVFLDTPPGVSVSYSKDISNQIRGPILNAMSAIAKLDLLRELAKLGDPEITRIANHADEKIKTLQDSAEITSFIERSLGKVFNYVSPHPSRGLRLFSPEKHVPLHERTPMQEAIYQALLTRNIDSIRSTEAVKEVMQHIKQPAQGSSLSMSQEKG